MRRFRLIISSPACGKRKAKSWNPAPCLQPILVTGTITPSCPAGAACPPRLLPSPFQHRFGSQRKALELWLSGIKPRSPGVDFSAWLRRFPGDLGAAVSQPAAESVTQPRRGSVHGAGKANTGSSAVPKRWIPRPRCQGQTSAASAGGRNETQQEKSKIFMVRLRQ